MAITVHVHPDPRGGWLIKRDGSAKDAGHFQSRGEAENRGRELARELSAELVVHHLDGSENRESQWRIAHRT
ncbi:DUF2188 domain-containing protein [Desulfuromonas sp. TF]|jgi:hypothetical protein|uniref:DUF2188 domain-containing protein n=1 Tax=Desulfuromonas sp. TF TaxID=1232410 RepID=UPI000402E918|nr:DUF2188 domain-containing protein [Desulfuromonas sp. TF]